MYDSGPDKVLLDSSDNFLHMLLHKFSQSSLSSCSRVVCIYCSSDTAQIYKIRSSPQHCCAGSC